MGHLHHVPQMGISHSGALSSGGAKRIRGNKMINRLAPPGKKAAEWDIHIPEKR